MTITSLDDLKANPGAVVVILIFNDSVEFNCWFESPFLPGEFATIRQFGRKPFGTVNHGLAGGVGKDSKHAAKDPLVKRIKRIPV